MAKHYLDFVGLNTFIYEPVGWDLSQQGDFEWVSAGGGDTVSIEQNLLGQMMTTPFTFYYLKNHLFPYNLPTTASFFPALMIHRNGPYGFPTWKQIRISENPLTRKQRKENIYTIIEEPGPEITYKRNGRNQTVRGRYGNLLRYNETPVISRFKPITVVAGSQILTDEGQTIIENYELKTSLANETIRFNNDALTKKYVSLLQKSKQYEDLSGYYLNGALNSDASPLDVFQFIKYSETVYPPQIYAYKNYSRQRTTFSFPWRDSRDNRTEEVADQGFESAVTQSMWILDAYSTWDTQSISVLNRWNNWYGYDRNSVVFSNYGILQNQYSFGAFDLPGSLSYTSILDYIRVAPQYNRKHSLTPSSSVISPNGMRLEGINSGSSMGDLHDTKSIPSGEAKWEAGSQSGLNPFYDSYDDYVQGVRQKGKGFSIVPEFKISDFVEKYQASGSTTEIPDFLSLTGALSDINVSASAGEQFYKTYTNSEFLRHFEMVREDHKDFVDPFSITMKCKGIKKLLPYEGFYPAQRTVQMAQQFYESYKDHTSVSGSTANSPDFNVSDDSRFLFQNLMAPTYAPGIMFNSIKAGVACDYPVIDKNLSFANQNVYLSGSDYYLGTGSVSRAKVFDRRIPFEAIIDPEDYLTDRIYCNEPHLYANNSGSVLWDGNGDKLYKLMASNFLAETANFFLKNSNFTSISSKPSVDPNVGNAVSGTTYMMRIKMYKTLEGSNIPTISGSQGFYTPPQYKNGTHENFTMYSRPSAFGPPSRPKPGLIVNGSDSGLGENYAFTPPYYYGQAYCDVTFTATQTKKYTINEIINSIRENDGVRQWRYFDDTDAVEEAKTDFINGNTDDGEGVKGDAMSLNSSVNVLSEGRILSDSVVIDASGDRQSRWVIQTKYETPMLNFAHLSSTSSVTLPNNASQSVPRGMWHQYGQTETDPAKGIFMQVSDVPSDWINNVLRTDSTTTGSLTDLCGFSRESVRLGEAADTKVIREAVVAVPFVEQEGQRKFFTLDRIDVENAQGPADKRALVGDSILQQIDRMKRFVFPPSMDFLSDDGVDPFAMYIFEFSHTLSKQDVTDIWQNLYPKIGRTFEEVESTISHNLLANELLGGGSVRVKDSRSPSGFRIEKMAKGVELPREIRWMVFKVKQRAEIDYYKKIVSSRKGIEDKISYNWPYDFFSLVEVAQLDAEITLAKREEVEIEEDSIVAIQADNPRNTTPAETPLVDRSKKVNTTQTISAGASVATSIASGPAPNKVKVSIIGGGRMAVPDSTPNVSARNEGIGVTGGAVSSQGAAAIAEGVEIEDFNE